MGYGPKSRPLADRFNEKWALNTYGCWVWRGARGTHGYGVIGIDGDRTRTAHRVSWELHRGPIPDGLFVLHNCDVKGCVNPNHLRLGTVLDNAKDLMERGKPFLEGLKMRWRKHG